MKQKLLNTFLLLSVLMASSCLGDDVDIENNRRLLVTGKVTDVQGTAIPNISVITSAHGDALGRTTTDANGNFYLVSLDEQFDPLDININVHEFYNQNTNQNYGSRSYQSPEHTNRVRYDMGTIILGKRAELKFTFNNIPGDQNRLDYKIFFTPAECELPLNIINPPESCDFSEEISSALSPSSEDKTLIIKSILGSIVRFEYSLNAGPTETIEISLTNESNSYVFEY